MNKESTHILNSFIKAPDLKIRSKKYPFEFFDFQGETIADSEFHFPKNSILGIQAEACFGAYLNNSKNYTLLTSNLQIQGETETLGELDYIVRNLKTNQVVHIELACKFYLYDMNVGVSEAEKWIGPNRKDSLFEKLEKIKQKQFPLINSKESIKKLKTLKIDFPASQELCLKAFLFIPQEMDDNLISDKYRECVVGYWIKQADFKELNSDALFAIPTKKEWLLPFESITSWLSFFEIELEIKKKVQNQISSLVYKKTSNKIERFFVVWW